MKMKTSVNDKIGGKLDITVEEQKMPEVISPTEVSTISNASEFERDYTWTRENIMGLIQTGQNSLEELFEIARQSQNPRAFEVISELIKTVANANKSLLDLHRPRRQHDPNAGPDTINNNLFVGSTADLMSLIKKSNIDE